MLTDYSVVFVTVGSLEEGVKIGRSLVEKELIACANLIPNVTSIYRWEGEVKEDQEWLLVLKTRNHLFLDIRDEVLRLHSYDVPEIVELPVRNGYYKYLEWIDESIHSHWSETKI